MIAKGALRSYSMSVVSRYAPWGYIFGDAGGEAFETEGYQSGHNEVLLKSCENFGRQSPETPDGI